MKKLMLMPLLVGVIWVCHASPTPNNQVSDATTISQLGIDASLIKEVFTEAVPLFKSQHGIDTSVPELQIGYDDGTVTVSKIAGEKSYLVTKDGNPVIVELDDFI
jgi:hypothetical protein